MPVTEGSATPTHFPGATAATARSKLPLVSGPHDHTDCVYGGFNFRRPFVNELFGQLRPDAIGGAARPLDPTMMPSGCQLHPFEMKPSFAAHEVTTGSLAKARAERTAWAHLTHGTDGQQFWSVSEGGRVATHSRAEASRTDRYCVQDYELTAIEADTAMCDAAGAVLLPIWVCEYQLSQAGSPDMLSRAFVWGGEHSALQDWAGPLPEASPGVWRTGAEAYEPYVLDEPDARALQRERAAQLARDESAAQHRTRIRSSASYKYLQRLTGADGGGDGVEPAASRGDGGSDTVAPVVQSGSGLAVELPVVAAMPKPTIQHVRVRKHTDPMLSAIKVTFWATVLPVAWADTMMLCIKATCKTGSMLTNLCPLVPLSGVASSFGLGVMFGAHLWLEQSSLRDVWDRAKAETSQERLANVNKHAEARWQEALAQFGPVDPQSYLGKGQPEQNLLAGPYGDAFASPVWRFVPEPGAAAAMDTAEPLRPDGERGGTSTVRRTQQLTWLRALLEYGVMLALIFGCHYLFDGPWWKGPMPAFSRLWRTSPAPAPPAPRSSAPPPSRRASTPAPIPAGGGFPEDHT